MPLICKLPRLLLVLLAVLAATSSLRAQVEEEACDDLVGTYELTKPGGAPPVPGAQVGVTVTENPDGTLTGDVWIDRRDGLGRIPIPAEQMEITPGCHDYDFVNARGTTGHISPNSSGGYDSSTSTGHHRVWTKI